MPHRLRVVVKAVGTTPLSLSPSHQNWFAFFHRLGVDPAKPGEVYVFYRDAAGLLLYGGWYHLVGHIQKDEEGPSLRPSREMFLVSFSEAADLVPKDFSRPVLQMDIMAGLPWVLEEACGYTNEGPPVQETMKLDRGNNGTAD